MKISDRKELFQKAKPLTCSGSESVLDAVKRMAEKNFGSIIVVDETDRVVGMMTERDIFRRLIAAELDPKVTLVDQIMTAPVRTAKADDELVDWLRMMSNERFRRLPIVDDDGKIVAVMTQGDFVSYTWPELLGRFRELAKASLPARANPLFLIVAVLLYSLVLVVAITQLI